MIQGTGGQRLNALQGGNMLRILEGRNGGAPSLGEKRLCATAEVTLCEPVRAEMERHSFVT